MIAVTQLLNVSERRVICWLPRAAPTEPPLKVRSVAKPAEPKRRGSVQLRVGGNVSAQTEKEILTALHEDTLMFGPGVR